MVAEVLGSPELFKVLGHDVRWALVQHLTRTDLRAGELVARLQERQNLVSYHLRVLRESGLVNERRSSRDARDIYYSLDVANLESAMDRSSRALHPALRTVVSPSDDEAGLSPARRVLFLCTANSARSQIAEAILRYVGRGVVIAQSAGSRPREVHPMAIQVLGELGYPTDGLRSKPIEEFIGDRFDWIITLCDNVREECPAFPGDPMGVHWSFADPAAVAGTEDQVREAFRRTALELAARIRLLRLTMRQRDL